MPYHAFLSYSHAADGRLAPALQSAVQGFARPWHQVRGAHLFRDKTGLSLTPELWPAIERALSESLWFILLASPESAASAWVRRELEYWLEHKSVERLLIVLTDGEISCNVESGTIDWSRTTALPELLKPALAAAPLYLDLRWARTEEHLSVRNARFRDAVSEIAAPLRGKAKDELVGEDLRLRKRALQLACFAVLALAVLTGLATWQAFVANQQRRTADEQRALADQQRQRADAQRKLAEERGRAALSRQLAAESVASLDDDPTLSYRLAEAAVDIDSTRPAQAALFRVFDRQACFSRLTLGPHEAVVSDAAFSPDGRWVLTATFYDSSRVWDADRGFERFRFGDDEIRYAVFSHDATHIWSVARRNRQETLVVWDTEGHKVRAWKDVELVEATESTFAEATGFALDGLAERQLVSVDGNRQLRIENDTAVLLDERDVPICRLVGHRSAIEAARFSFDGRRIVTASRDWTARVWDVPAPQPRVDAPAPPGARFRLESDGVTDTINRVKARPEGTVVVLVDVETQRQLRQLVGHTGTIDQVVFSPDGSQIVTNCLEGLSAGEFDTSVRVWDVATGQQLRQLPRGEISEEILGVPGGASSKIGFTSDGHGIVVNGTVWPATWKDVIRAVSIDRVRGVPRQLTDEEKQQHGLDRPAPDVVAPVQPAPVAAHGG